MNISSNATAAPQTAQTTEAKASKSTNPFSAPGITENIDIKSINKEIEQIAKEIKEINKSNLQPLSKDTVQFSAPAGASNSIESTPPVAAAAQQKENKPST